MSLWIDRKYILLVSSSLRNFKERRSNLFNASCVFCGDSQKDSSRARMYAYEHHNSLLVKCFNCGISTNMAKLLEQVNPEAYREYCLEKFANKSPPVTIQEVEEVLNRAAAPQSSVGTRLFPLADPEYAARAVTGHALDYVRSRLIPMGRWSDLFYAPDFKELMDADWPDHGKELIEGEGRLVWYMTNLDEYVTHVCGRILGSDGLRYMKIRVQGKDGDPKVFGLSHADLSLPVYVLEGELDSLFIPNAVASGDSNLERLSDELKEKFGVETIVIYDNEPRNKEIVKQMGRAIHGGHTVVVWPDAMEGKDINEMVLKGTKPEHILEVIKDNSYSGPQAELEYARWKKW